MSKWDEYQEFSTNAKPHGGTNAYLEILESNAKEEGREEGRTEGGIIGSLVTLAAVGIGAWVFNKAKDYYYKRKEAKQLAAAARQEFLDNVDQYTEQENSQSNDNCYDEVFEESKQ